MNNEEIQKKLQEFKPVMDGLSRARNPFELRYFVIGKHDDRIQQYKQAIVEMDAKYRAIEEAQHTISLKDLEKEELELKKKPIQTRLDSIHNEKLDLEIAKIERDKKYAHIAMTGALKEVLDFITIVENEFSDLLPLSEEELIQKGEISYWKERFAKQLQVDMISNGRVSAGNLSSLLSMPKEVQEDILSNAIERTEEWKLLDQKVAKNTALKLADSNPKKTKFVAPPLYTPLKLLKDAPEGYPEDRIVKIDKAEIMIATLHRPGDTSLSEQFYIPTGKNYISHWVECDDPSMVGEWRNRIVMDALSLGCTHIFFVDDDLIVDNGALQKLYAHNLDIVGGWYPQKKPVIESSTLIKDGDTKMGVPLESTGLVKIDWALAAGLTLIKTEVFRKMSYPWYLTTDHGTEDTYFTQRALEAGIDSWLDTSVKAIHVDKKTNKQYIIE